MIFILPIFDNNKSHYIIEKTVFANDNKYQLIRLGYCPSGYQFLMVGSNGKFQ